MTEQTRFTALPIEMSDPSPSKVTEILLDLSRQGTDGREATDRLYEAVYPELRRLASKLMRGERVGHTLQPTALVNEAYLRLVNPSAMQWQNRAHFFSVAARAMRRILVNHARDRAASKRGGGWQRITYDEAATPESEPLFEVIALDDALERLAQEDERMARVVELRVFAGLPAREAAHVLGVSKRTVDNDWRVAKLWLLDEMTGRAG